MSRNSQIPSLREAATADFEYDEGIAAWAASNAVLRLSAERQRDACLRMIAYLDHRLELKTFGTPTRPEAFLSLVEDPAAPWNDTCRECGSPASVPCLENCEGRS